MDDNGVATLIYSGSRGPRQLPCLATSTDERLVQWEKFAGNPVIAAPPPDLDIIEFRDHSVWREGDDWYQVIGAGVRDVGGTALLYRSSDLRSWEYLHPLYTGDLHQTEPVWTGSVWECPQFLDLGASHVLIVSAWHQSRTLYTVALTGTYRDHRFHPEIVQKFDYGDNYFYAPQACIDAAGRSLLWGWLQEGRSEQAQRDAGWSGVMSLPRVVTAGEDRILRVVPAPELKTLRDRQHHIDSITITSTPRTIEQMQGDCLELVVEIDPDNADQIALLVRSSPDGAEQTVISYDMKRQWLAIDSTRASLDASITRDLRGGLLVLEDGEPLRLHVFVDRSVIEVFANERACVTGRAYPTRADALGVGVVSVGGTARIAAMDAWTIRSIWE